MNENKISVRYAKSLFALGKETDALLVLKQDIELLYQCIREIPELKVVIHSPVIRSLEKIKLFDEMFRAAFNPVTLTFIRLVLDKRREEYLAGISRYFLTLMKTEQGIQAADVVTATPLSENLRQSILNLITRKFKAQVELNESVDPALIGGFILRVGDQQIDASITSKLRKIKQELIQSHTS